MALPALAIAGIVGGAKALGGIGQMLFAPKKQEEPKYEIPKEVFEATQRAQEMAQTGMPEASRMQALQGAQQSAVFGMRAAQDRRGGLAAIGNIQAQMDRSALGVAAQDAATRLQNQRFAQQALMTQAGYRDKAFANQWQSWMNKEQQRRALIGAGMQNIMGGIDMFGSIMALDSSGTKTSTTATDNKSLLDYKRDLSIANIGSNFVTRAQGRTLLGVPEDQNPYGMSDKTLLSYGTKAISTLSRLF